jgi:GT2 family glycosyltransferase
VNKGVSIIIASSNRIKSLKKCLDSIRKQSYEGCEIILVAIKKNPDYTRLATEYGAKLYEDSGKGLCGARNIGLAKSSKEIILFLDDDVELCSDYLEKIIGLFRREEIGGVGGVAITPAKHEAKLFSLRQFLHRRFDFYVKSKVNYTYVTNSLSGCNMAFRKKVLLEVNGSDENFYGSCAGEDSDLSYRVKEKGHQLLIEPSARVIHYSNFIRRAREKNHEYFRTLADNQTYWRIKNNILRTHFYIVLYYLDQIMKAFFWTIQKRNLLVYKEYIIGLILGYKRGKIVRLSIK